MEYFKKILILVAMPEETLPIVRSLNMVALDGTFDKYLPVDWYVSLRSGVKIYLAITRKSKKFDVPQVGPQIASMVAWETMRSIEPDLVVNIGVAGGLASEGAIVGDVYQCSQAIYYDRVFAQDEYIQYGIGNYPCEIIPKEQLESESENSLKTGIVATGSGFMTTQEDIAIIEANQAALKDTEAAAIVEMANIRNIPVAVIKVITDLVGDDLDYNKNAEAENFSYCIGALEQAIPSIIDYYCTDKAVEQDDSSGAVETRKLKFKLPKFIKK